MHQVYIVKHVKSLLPSCGQLSPIRKCAWGIRLSEYSWGNSNFKKTFFDENCDNARSTDTKN